MKPGEWANSALKTRLADPNRTTGSYRKRSVAHVQSNQSLKPLFSKMGVAEAYHDARSEKDPALRRQKIGVYIQKHTQFVGIVKKAQARNKQNPQMVGKSLGSHAEDIHQEILDKAAKQAEAKKKAR